MSKAACLPVAAIVLAAGAATRMGKLKQVLAYGGRTLVQHVVEQAVAAGFAPIIVVAGAEAAPVRAAVAAQPVSIVENRNWESGMGSSIVSGVRFLGELESDAAAVAILLADQPLVTAKHLMEMRTLLHNTNAAAIAAQYGGTLGVPALFKREMFAALRSLPASGGARHILRDSGIEVAAFPLPEAAVDIDTPEDFYRLGAGG